MYPLKYNTASQEVPLGYFLDSTDGDTEETGLTIANTDIKLHKTGATTLANKNSGGATHISNGIYYATLNATDTNTYGPMTIFVHVSGALANKLECVVMNADAYDALYAANGTGNIETNVVEVNGTAQTANDNGADLATITGADGVTLATSQGNYAPNKVVPDPAGTAPTVNEIINTAQTEVYAAQGSTASITQLLYMIWSLLKSIVNVNTTTPDSLKVDDSTVAMSFETDSATVPTQIKRTS